MNSGINIYTLRRKEFTDDKFMYMKQEKNETLSTNEIKKINIERMDGSNMQ